MKNSRQRKLWVALISVLLLCLIAGAVTMQVLYKQEQVLEEQQNEFVQELQDNEGRYDAQSIVLTHTSEPAARELAEKLGAKLRITKDGSFATLTLPEGITILDVAKSEDYLADLPSMSADYQARITEVTEENEEGTDERLPMRPQCTVSDTSYELQTYLDYMNLGNVWATTRGNGVTVAVIDTGIDTDHPEFAGRISEYSYNATEDKIVKDYLLEDGSYDWSLIEDEQGHGTSVAGVIGASMNSGEIVGIAPKVTLIVIKAECDENGTFTRTSDLVFGLYYAIERDVAVVNMSFGSQSPIDPYAEPAQLAGDSDIICLAAAGNESTAALTYPAANPNVIGVGALAEDSWELAKYSNYGENVDIVAPGTTYTTAMGGGYKSTDGTSLACPAAVGAIALMRSLGQYKYAETRDILEILYASCYDLGDLGHDWYYGYGAVDISALILEDQGTVTFNMMTDELDNTEQLFIRNHTLQNMPEPERLYAIFDGWYYDPQCTEEYNWYADEFSADLTLYANWVNEEDGIPYTYVILEDGTVEIRSYTGHRRYITIPDYIEGRIVSSIGVGAFAGQTRLREVNLPKYLVRIRDSAFYGCSNLIGMTIPDTVTEIGEKAFMDNVRMSAVIFGERSQLRTIGARAFAGLGKLRSITLPSSLEVIYPYAFVNCFNLSTVTFSGNSHLHTIGNFTFQKCTNLKTITLPASLTTMNGSAFCGATSMQAFAVQDGNNSFTAIDGVLFDDTTSRLVCYPASRTGSYDIPDSTIAVGEYAFAYSALSGVELDGVQTLGDSSFAYSALTSVTIPDSVISMGGSAFFACIDMQELHIGLELWEISDHAFNNCINLLAVHIPANVQAIGEAAFSGTVSMTTVTFEEGSQLSTIGDETFFNSGITGIEIPASVTTIGGGSFAKSPDFHALHYALSSVTFEEGSKLQTIGKSAFAYNLALTEIDLPTGLQTIGDFAFAPAGLQKVTLPSSLTSLGTGAFAWCDSLENIFVEQGNTVYHDVEGVVYDIDNTTLVEYPAGNPRTEYTILDGMINVGQYAFCGSNILRYVTFSDSLITVEEYGFYDCQGIYGYDLNENLAYIERYAFSENYSLQTMAMPDSVMQISNYAFAGDWNLASVTFNETAKLPRISFGAFAYCGLTSFRVPPNVSTMAQSAFEGCNKLTSFTFAENSKLESISAYMFDGCSNLRTITFEPGSALTSIQAHGLEGMRKLATVDFGNAPLTNIDNFAFRFCESLTNLTIPEGVTNLGRFAFYYCESLSEVTIPASMEHIGRFAFLGTSDIDLYFAGESLPAYLDEDWDHGIKSYYLGVTDVITDGDWKYATLTSGNIGILDYTGSDTTIDMTALDFGGDIVNIGGKAFFFAEQLEQITLPNTLTTIQAEAFYHSGLTEITIPDSVTFIGREAFAYTPITSVAFGDDSQLVTIEQSAFEMTENLTNVTIPGTVTNMGRAAFKSSGITSVTFGEGFAMTEIPEQAFAYTHLTSVTIPDSVTLINHNAFRNISELESVTWGSGADLMVMSNAFYQSGLKNLHIPANMTFIGEYAFVALPNLTEFTVDEGNPYYTAVDGLLVGQDGRKLIAVPAGRTGALYVPVEIEVIGFGAFEDSKLSEINFSPDANILSFGYRAFYNAKNITEMYIPASVVAVDYYAFANCSNLSKVTLAEGSGLNGVYEGAFLNCFKLSEILLPDGIDEISDFAFYGCRKLTSVPVSETTEIKGIFDYAMAYTGISGEFATPETLIEIGPYAFLGTRVTKVTIPDTNYWDLVIGIGAFEDCNHLEEISVPFIGASFDDPDITWFGYIFGAGSYTANSVYVPESLKKVTISSDITFVGEGGFYNLTGLEEINVPHSVTTLYAYAFGETTAKYALTNEISIIDNVGYYIIRNFHFGTGIAGSLTLSDQVTRIDNEVFRGCTGLTSITIPDSVTSIGFHAFRGCTGLTSVTIGNGVTSIDSSVFWDCSGLTSVIMGDSVTSIGSSAFYGCTGLTSITIPDSVTSIGSGAFWGCTGLTSVIIGNGVTSIDSSVFWGCSDLTSVIMGDSVTSIGNDAFYGCTNLTSVYVDDIAAWCAISFGGNANPLSYAENFYLDNELVTEIVIPDGVTSIDAWAFYGCSSLVSITIPDSVTSIGSSAFSGCTGLTSITIPDDVTSIGSYAFSRCTGLTSITIPDSVTSIGDYAFSECDGLTSITIPDSVTSIGDRAFSGCSSLYEIINLSDLPLTIGSSDYGDVAYYAKVIIDQEGNKTYRDEASGFEYVDTADGFRFMKENSQYTLITYLGDEDTVTLPLTINGQDYTIDWIGGASHVIIPEGMTSIGWGAFSGCTGLTSITIPDSVTSIGNSAFDGCRSLTSITIPDSVTSIGALAFCGCTGLTSITIPNSVKSIGWEAFYHCTGLTSITIPDSVTSIDDFAFWGCTGLTSVIIGDSVTSIGNYTFEHCTGLTSVIIGDSVTSIGDSAFGGCTGLKSITIPDNVKSIGNGAFAGCEKIEITIALNNPYFTVIDGVIYSKNITNIIYVPESMTEICIPKTVTSISLRGNTTIRYVFFEDGSELTSIGARAFEGCIGLTSITIPDSVTSIGYAAFSGCDGLTSITIPDSVTSIGQLAFENCAGLTSIHVGENNSMFFSQDGILYQKVGNTILAIPGNLQGDVTIPDSVTSIGSSAFYGCTGLTSITIPDSVTSIGDYAFSGCTGLTSITIPDSVTSIGSFAFYGCTGLTSVTIGDGVTSIGSSVFRGCSGLTSVIMGDSVTSIGNYAFENCTGLTSITIPDSVTSIGSSAFWGCTGLTSVTIGNGVKIIGSNAFENCRSLTSITIPDSVISIGNHAFENCRSLTSVTIGNGVTSIDDYAFYNCKGLTSVTIPDSVTSIGSCAFHDCTSLTSITIGNGVTSIGSSAFYNCKGLTSVTIPDSVTSIGSSAFSRCTGLMSITIPDGVTSIGNYTFEHCAGLTSITIPDSVTSIGSSAFYGCTGLTSITIPDSVTSIGDRAFFGCSSLYEIINLSDLTLVIGSSDYGDVAYYAKVIIDQEGNKTYRDEASGFEYVDTADGFRFMKENSQYTLIAYFGDEDTVTLPLSINDQEYTICLKGGASHVIIPDGMTSIGSRAFSGCAGLTSITIPNSVTSIGASAFSDCTGLTSITIPDSVTNIGNYAFSRCRGLTSITIPNSVTSIGDSAFENCTGLTSITISDCVTSIGFAAFRGCTGLTSITIPDSVTSIGDYAFSGCTGLTSITIGNGVTSIGDGAFYDTAYYNDVSNWEEGVLYVGRYLIRVSEALEYYPIKEDTICWANDAFEGCYKLKALSIGGNNRRALQTLTNLETLIITEMPERIKDYFGYAVSDIPLTLKNIVLADGVRMSAYAFYDGYRYGNPITDMNIYVAGTEKDTMWDENFPGWQTGNKVFYGDKWSWVTFCDNAGNVTAQAPQQNSQIVRQQFAEDYTDDTYLYMFQGYDINGDGIADTLPAQTDVDIHAVMVYEKEYRCVNEGHLYGDWTMIIEPTCLDQGEKAHYCAYCGKAEYETIDATGHNYKATITVPTCTEQGYTTHTCHCGDFYVDSYVEKTGHGYGDWYTTTEPTCTGTGIKRHDCSVCGHYEEQSIAALGHNMGGWYQTLAPTCTTEGENRRDCGRGCGYYETEVVPANGHTPADAVEENHVDPTCTEIGGYDMVVYCTICGAELSREHYDIDVLGHNMGEWYQTVVPTCTTEGENKRDCSRCDYFETEVIPANGHSPADVVVENRVEPTCTEIGGYDMVIYCIVCDVELSREYYDIDALDHDMGEWYQTIAPTCTVEGQNKRDCDRCDYYETEVVPANGHAPADAVEENHVDPTCTEIGGYDMVVYCAVCDVELSREHYEIDALGHAPATGWTEDLAPTCTTVGSKSHHCTRCDEKLDITEIPANGHSHTGVVTDPTCTSKGFITFYCHCGDNYFGDWVDALGHTEAIDAAVAPTCAETGLTEGKHCSVCNEVLVAQEVVPATGHTYESVVTDPTCTEQGFTTHTCHCGDVYVDSEVEALGHIPSDWIVDTEAKIGVVGSKHTECTICGETLETAIIEALPVETDAETETEAEAPTVADSKQEDPKPSNSCSSNVNASVFFVVILAAISTLFFVKRKEKNC